MIGFVGGYEHGLLEATQLWKYELRALSLLGISWVVYILRQLVLADFIRRSRILRKKARARAMRQKAYNHNRYTTR
jgi:hypothetical protein